MVCRKEVENMKRPISDKALMKEASFWDDLKRVIKENPVKACHK
jgi:hypothetical protein